MAFLRTAVLALVAASFFMGSAHAARRAQTEATLRWHAIEGASSYRLQVSRDEKLEDVVLDTRIEADPNVGTQSHRFTELKAGSYYGFVDGYSAEGVFIGRVATIPLVVGSPLTITGSRRVAAPPHPLKPRPGAKFLPKERIQFIWSKVKEADRYRFRIVSEDHPEIDLMITDQKENTIALSDVPPSSYRYLSPGRYRWIIACLTGPSDLGGEAGDEVASDFEVVESLSLAGGGSRAGFRLRLTGAVGPYVLSSFSGLSRSVSEDRGLAPGASVDATAWFGGGWGAQFMAGLRSIPNFGGGNETRTPRELSLRGTHRKAFSVHAVDNGVELGWVREIHLGLAMREILQIDGGSTVRDPTLRGIDIGFEIQRRNSLHWGWHLRVNDLIPLQINADVPADLNGVNFINFGVEWQLEHYFTRDAWAGIGPRAHYSKNKYDQGTSMTTTRNFGLELAAGLGFLF